MCFSLSSEAAAWRLSFIWLVALLTVQHGSFLCEPCKDFGFVFNRRCSEEVCIEQVVNLCHVEVIVDVHASGIAPYILNLALRIFRCVRFACLSVKEPIRKIGV